MNWEIGLVFFFLVVTVYLFSREQLRVDVIAILIMLGLAWTRLVSPAEAFSGFSSNAVIAVIGVMILGFGLDRSGAMNNITRFLLKTGGENERKLIVLVSAAAAVLSAFMQNIGATVLFLPVLIRISRSGRISLARILMPMGFASILGGTTSMVGSGPLIILNDLLKQDNLEKFGLFSVTPIGLPLVAVGIGYFLLFRHVILPKGDSKARPTIQQEMVETWHLPQTVFYYSIPSGSRIVGRTREEIKLWTVYKLNLLIVQEGNSILHAPWRDFRFSAGQTLVLLGGHDNAERFAQEFDLLSKNSHGQLQDLLSTSGSGFAEVIIPPRSGYVGYTLRDMAMRKNYSVEPIILLSGSSELREGFSDQLLKPGDTFVVFGPWENIKAMDDKKDFVVVTPTESSSPKHSQSFKALFCFAGAVTLAILGFSLSLAFFSGALAMILLRIISIDDAYQAVDWRTVFLLAGLIPLGIAMDKSGTVGYLAHQLMYVLQGQHPLLILLAVAVLSTVFSLFMSNVAATVLLVPLVINMGRLASLDPRMLALLAAVCASNSFILPTHQVNALLMSPGGYHNSDYLKAGGIMTIIFIILAVGIVYSFYI